MPTEKLSYITLMIKFFGPLIFLAALLYHRKIIKNWRTMLGCFVFAVIGYLIADPLAAKLGAWFWDPNKTISPLVLGGTVLDNMLWAILLCLFVGAVLIVWTEKEDKNQPFIFPSRIYNKLPESRFKKFVAKIL